MGREEEREVHQSSCPAPAAPASAVFRPQRTMWASAGGSAAAGTASGTASPAPARQDMATHTLALQAAALCSHVVLPRAEFEAARADGPSNSVQLEVPQAHLELARADDVTHP
ncbi:hypothetical protein C8R44DRAFT_749519 [Mycena epipterygia]|nr:hypothetical protein C8R44DRAFT_749519 [Mycena epipterygia]